MTQRFKLLRSMFKCVFLEMCCKWLDSVLSSRAHIVSVSSRCCPCPFSPRRSCRFINNIARASLAFSWLWSGLFLRPTFFVHPCRYLAFLILSFDPDLLQPPAQQIGPHPVLLLHLYRIWHFQPWLRWMSCIDHHFVDVHREWFSFDGWLNCDIHRRRCRYYQVRSQILPYPFVLSTWSLPWVIIIDPVTGDLSMGFHCDIIVTFISFGCLSQFTP